VKFPPVTLFRDLVLALKGAWIPKNFPKAGYECTLCKINRPMRAKESLKRNLMRLSEQTHRRLPGFLELFSESNPQAASGLPRIFFSVIIAALGSLKRVPGRIFKIGK
jgi:hypothetical protein